MPHPPARSQIFKVFVVFLVSGVQGTALGPTVTGATTQQQPAFAEGKIMRGGLLALVGAGA